MDSITGVSHSLDSSPQGCCSPGVHFRLSRSLLSSGLQKALSSHFLGPGKITVLLPLASSFCNILYGTPISTLVIGPCEGALLELS